MSRVANAYGQSQSLTAETRVHLRRMAGETMPPERLLEHILAEIDGIVLPRSLSVRVGDLPLAVLDVGHRKLTGLRLSPALGLPADRSVSAAGYLQQILLLEAHVGQAEYRITRHKAARAATLSDGEAPRVSVAQLQNARHAACVARIDAATATALAWISAPHAALADPNARPTGGGDARFHPLLLQMMQMDAPAGRHSIISPPRTGKSAAEPQPRCSLLPVTDQQSVVLVSHDAQSHALVLPAVAAEALLSDLLQS